MAQNTLICRICLITCESMKSLFDVAIFGDNSISIVDFLIKIASIKIVQEDGLPQCICSVCLENICKTYSLIELVKNSDTVLRSQNIQRTIFENNKHIKTNRFSKATGDNGVLETNFKFFTKELFLKNNTKIENVGQLENGSRKTDNNVLYSIEDSNSSNTEPSDTFASDKCLLTDRNINKHIKNHKYKKKVYECSICSKSFAYPSFLTEHMKNHTGEKPYLCSICGSRFQQRGGLNYHLKSHTGLKPHKCALCNSKFARTSSLKVHMRKHTNERPYVCDICGSAFRQLSDMKGHRKLHSGKKEFMCNLCGKLMMTKGQLSVHHRTHTGERPFPCSQCSKAFATNALRLRHLRIHTGERPYICTTCGRSFNQTSTLKTHQKVHSK